MAATIEEIAREKVYSRKLFFCLGNRINGVDRMDIFLLIAVGVAVAAYLRAGWLARRVELQLRAFAQRESWQRKVGP